MLDTEEGDRPAVFSSGAVQSATIHDVVSMNTPSTLKQSSKYAGIPKFELSLTNWPLQNQLFLGGTILGCLAALLLYAGFRLQENSPDLGIDFRIPFVLGYAGCIGAGVMLLVAFVLLYLHLFECNSLVLDENGLTAHYLWLPNRVVLWDSKPVVQLIQVPEEYKGDHGLWVPLFWGGVGKLIYQAFAPTPQEFFQRLVIDSPRFKLEERLDEDKADSLRMWFNLYAITGMIHELSGTITWSDQNIVGISLLGAQMNDEKFSNLAKALTLFPSLTRINLNQTVVSEKILPDLLRIESLQEVELFDNTFSISQMREQLQSNSTSDD